MEQIVYERPREKLLHNGARFLTNLELIQLVIGSGGAHYSGAQLARRLEQPLFSRGVSTATLMEITGIGVAKASQLLGALELGRRVALAVNEQQDMSKYHSLAQDAAQYSSGTVVCYWYDGAKQVLDYKCYVQQKNEHLTLIARRLFADAIAASARSLLVIFVTRHAVTQPDAQQLGALATVNDLSKVVGIHVIDVYAVHKAHIARWGTYI